MTPPELIFDSNYSAILEYIGLKFGVVVAEDNPHHKMKPHQKSKKATIANENRP